MQEDVNSKDITKKVEIKEKKVRKVPQKKVRAKKFRKGKWNPLIQIVHYDFLKNEPDHDVKLDDSVRMSNLNAIRAVFTNDLKLMEKVFFDTKNISTLNACWSPDIDMTALDYLAQRNQVKMLELIIAPELHIELHETYDKLRAGYYSQRANQSEEYL